MASLGPVPAVQLGQLLLDLKAAAERSYARFGLSSEMPARKILYGSIPRWPLPGCPDELIFCSRGIQPSGIQNAALGGRCAIVPEALLQIEIARCWPVKEDNTPDVAGQERTSLKLAQDATVLFYGLAAEWAEGTLFESYQGIDCEAVTLGVMQPVGPNGLFAGWTWQIRARMVAPANAT